MRVVTDAVPWFDAWVAASSGPAGFWLQNQPAEHFRTASAAGPELAGAVLALLDRRLDVRGVLEVGAGDGRLLEELHWQRPDLRLAGTDLRPRPVGLPGAVGWVQDRWDVSTGGWASGGVERLLAGCGEPVLLLAVEWLDDLPCRLGVRTDAGWAELDAQLRPAAPLGAADQAWLRTWWPDGERVEAGSTRDEAWAWLVAALAGPGGLALAVDYGHERTGRPAAGSLAAYRSGRLVAVRPAADRNLTAHVAVDALAAAGERAGARTLLRSRQADALADLMPAPAGGTDPLDDLVTRSRRAALTGPAGWGGHWWLLQEVPRTRPTATSATAGAVTT